MPRLEFPAFSSGARAVALAIAIAITILLTFQWFTGRPFSTTQPLAPGSAAVEGRARAVRLERWPLWIEVFENGRPLQQTRHREMAGGAGEGRFYWRKRVVILSATDATDPALNGRRYTARLPVPIPLALPVAAATITVLLLAFSIRASQKPRSGAPPAVQPTPAREPWQRWLVPVVIIAPSAFVFATVPILWKDVDAFFQVTGPWGVLNGVTYPPFYPFFARICLCLAEATPSFGQFLADPVLTQPGAILIVLSQHALLCAGIWSLVRQSTPRIDRQIALALLFAAASYPYVWAQTIGSESLSLALTFFAISSFIRLCLHRGSDTWNCALLGCWLLVLILTRHANSVLLILPLAAAAIRTLTAPGAFWRRGFRLAAAACLVVFLVQSAASICTAVVCRMAGVEARSRAGYVFQFRLDRVAYASGDFPGFIARLQARLPDPAIHRALDEWEAAVAGQRSRPEMLHASLVAALEKDDLIIDIHAEADRRLGAILEATVFPLDPAWLRTVFLDLAAAARWTAADVARSPFGATELISDLQPAQNNLGVRDDLHARQWLSLPALAEQTAADFARMSATGSYWNFPRLPTWTIAALAGTIISLLLAAAGWREKTLLAPGLIALTLCACGLLSWLMTTALTFNSPRFLLPVWTFSLAALCVAAGAYNRHPPRS